MTTKAKAPLCMLITLGLFVLAATPALASRPHEFSKAFGAKCLVAGSCTEEELFKPDGVAVNEATGDVYVVDQGEGAVGGRVVRFSKEGVVEGEFNGSETPAKDFERPETIAVDNSCVLRKVKEPALLQATCESEDPSNGDVYVVDQGHLVVDKFTAAGGFLAQISEGSEGRELDGLAVDAQGGFSVLQTSKFIGRYSNAAQNKFIAQVEIQAFSESEIAIGLGLDSAGNFYLGQGAGGATGTVTKVSPTGKILIGELDKEPSSAVALEQTSDNPFLDNLTTVAIFDPEGTLIERLGEEGGAKHLTQGAGIGVNASAGSFYVADQGASVHPVLLFGPAHATTPKIESESFEAVSSSTAIVAAKINPRSEPGDAVSEYSFQYGRCATPTSCKSSGYEASAPEPYGQIPADFSVHALSTTLTGLQPHTTYHFRAVAKNSHGEGTPGEEVIFETEGAGGSVVLPDNRAWELVSPPDKLGSLIEPIPEEGVVQAAASGQSVTYLADAPTEAQPQGYSNRVQVLSSRGSASWSSRDIALPHQSASGQSVGAGSEYRFFDPELDASAVQPLGQFNPQLSEEASESTAYLHELGPSCGSHCYRPLVTSKPGFADEAEPFGGEEACKPRTGYLHAQPVCGAEFVGATEDLSHIVLLASLALKTGEAPVEGLYEWSAGALSRVSVLPGGEATAGHASLGFNKGEAARGAISADGTRIVWELAGEPTGLYLRDSSRGETVQLDKAEVGCGSCESGGGKFQFASVDGSRAYFTDFHRLSEGSGAEVRGEGGKADLYECQIVIQGGKLACKLSDLTPAKGGEAAEVQGGVLGASEDGAYLYFVAKGVLSEVANSHGQSAAAGQPNLYLDHDGSMSFIATLSGGDEHDWFERLSEQPTRVSPNGQWLEFMSQASPTGYDNRDAASPSGQSDAEVYLYGAASAQLSCASCEPSGVRPHGVEYEKLIVGSGGLVGGNALWPASALVAANVPGWTQIGFGASRYQPRYLANSGRLFFNSADGLVAQDSNGTEDVYEYDPLGLTNSEGAPQCSEASATFSARSGGCVGLISSGRSAQESAFLDASESGDDVFFLTSAQLSPLDVDTSRDVYDAHVCSAGSPCITFPTTQSPPCTTEASCKASPIPQPAIFGAPASATFEGLGNTPAPPSAKPVVKKALTRAQKLAAALKACKKRPKSKRASCRKQARSKYGPLKQSKKRGRK